MDLEIKNRFISLWKKYFNNAELPIVSFYSHNEGKTELVKPGSLSRCVMGALVEVRKGRSLSFKAASVGCFGGRKYLGFADTIRPNFEYFLSCGIPGQLEGERYKKSPQLVKDIVKTWPNFKAPGTLITFKRWDNLEEEDNPDVITFFAQNDSLSGLFTLYNFEESTPEGVITPMSSGCAAIVSYPYLEKDSTHPRAVIGMFDPSARPHIEKDRLTISMPMSRFITMINNMQESFLITDTWKELQKRMD